MVDLVRPAKYAGHRYEIPARRGARQTPARVATDGAQQRSGVSMAAKQATATATVTATKKVKVLTEPDLLKAPEKDYMNEAQLAFFRRRLMELRDQLLQNADDTGEHLRENETTTDPSDRATLEEEYTLELRTRDRERKLLKKVEKSIKLIDEGNYGYCDETGEPIGIPRLLARPTATLSLEAQERRERVQKLYGD
jgi:DnaK suppressor protein